MKFSEIVFGLLRIPLDALAVLGALLLGYRLREAQVDLLPGIQLLDPAVSLPPYETYVDTFVVPSIAAFLVLAAALKMYSIRLERSAWVEIGRTMLAALCWLVAVMAWFFLVQKQLFYSRILLVHATLFIALGTCAIRIVLILLERLLLQWGIGVRTVVTIGTTPVPGTALRTLQDDDRYLYVGHLQDMPALLRVHGERSLDMVLQTDAAAQPSVTATLIEFCRSQHVGYGFLPLVFTDTPHLLQVEYLGLMPFLRFQPTPLDGWGRVLKRGCDLVGSVALLTLLSPLMLLVSVVILLTSGWPIFYVSRRVGVYGQCAIPMLKFRTMVRNADSLKQELEQQNERNDGPLFKLRADPRITPVGKFLRRWDIDEFPQLLNVILGHMSLVGPRPHLLSEVSRYSPYQRRVFAVKPGMTGLAQISGRSTLPFAEEVQLDLQYVEEWSLMLDLWIFWRTPWVVMKGHKG